jgi:hypothetical protein
MALLYELLNVSGRLQYISHQSLARDFDGDQLAMIHLITVPDDQDVDAQLEFISAQLPTCVAGFGGTYEDGSKWVVTFERGPLGAGGKATAVRDLRLHLAHMNALNPRVKVVQQVVLTRRQLLDHYPRWLNRGLTNTAVAAGALVAVDPNKLGVTDLLRGITVEACGYSLMDFCRAYPTGCGFPNRDHTCTGDVFGDVFQAFIERRLTPGVDGEEGLDEGTDEADGAVDEGTNTRRKSEAHRPRGPMPPVEELRPRYEEAIGRDLHDYEIEHLWGTGML